MVRTIGIVLVILGLIAQPLMAATPDFMSFGDTSSSISVDHADPGLSSEAPCHESSAEQSAPMPCTDCDGDCANGACASVCSLTTLAVLNQSLLIFERVSAVRIVGASGMLVQELRARIFHPPKHA